MGMQTLLVWAYIASSLDTTRRKITAGRSRSRSLLHAVTQDSGICRGGATKEVQPEGLKHNKKSQLLDGGTSSPSLSIRFKDCLSRLVRFARRIYQRWSQSTPKNHIKTTVHKNASASTQQVTRAPSTVATRKAARIAKELKEFLANPPENCKVSMGKNLNVWIVTITGANKTIFEGEKYKLRVAFPADYPTSPPSVYFLQPPPRHPHVYTNGDICLNLLGKDWRPNLSIAQLSLSILSMLSSAKQKGIPQDNALHATTPPGRPQEGWMYHDDSC